ncbi:hypothetical protein AA103581_1538 [Gluconobacter wancherniae NBRC 103581]|nr:hypothetical protein AA103581_1538 [Gluconobacter wancherniae NBRC 103581]
MCIPRIFKIEFVKTQRFARFVLQKHNVKSIFGEDCRKAVIWHDPAHPPAIFCPYAFIQMAVERDIRVVNPPDRDAIGQERPGTAMRRYKKGDVHLNSGERPLWLEPIR